VKKLDGLYTDILNVIEEASRTQDTNIINSALINMGMRECQPEDDRFLDFSPAYEIVDGDERILLQYRWYDASKTFQIKPDVNVYLVRQSKGGIISAEKELKFPDKSVY
jgi:hypothetical protein